MSSTAVEQRGWKTTKWQNVSFYTPLGVSYMMYATLTFSWKLSWRLPWRRTKTWFYTECGLALRLFIWSYSEFHEQNWIIRQTCVMFYMKVISPQTQRYTEETLEVDTVRPSVWSSVFFYLRFYRTWTKRNLITSQTRVKRVSRIHHRTILWSSMI